MADHDSVQDPGSELADEGVPLLEGQHPGKIASGDTHDGVVPPRTFPLGAEEYGTTASGKVRGGTTPSCVSPEAILPGW